jgi:hypothetical protein
MPRTRRRDPYVPTMICPCGDLAVPLLSHAPHYRAFIECLAPVRDNPTERASWVRYVKAQGYTWKQVALLCGHATPSGAMLVASRAPAPDHDTLCTAWGSAELGWYVYSA